MKKIEFRQTITTVANLGVIGGLIFVGLQLMQDRQIATNAAILDVANTRMYWAELVGQIVTLGLKAWPVNHCQ